MTRPRLPLLLICALCLVWQGAALFWAGRWAQAPLVPWPGLLALLALLTLGWAFAGWRAKAPRRAGLAMLGVAQIGFLLLTAGSLWSSREPPSGWTDRQRDLLAATVREQEQRITGLLANLDQMADLAVELAPSREAFALLAVLTDRWERIVGGGDGAVLTAAIWYQGERIAWDDRTVPLPLPSGQESGGRAWRLLQPSHDFWYCRQFRTVQLRDRSQAILEMQLPLAAISFSRDGRPTAIPGWLEMTGGRPRVTFEVVPGTGSIAESWQGDAEQGYRLTVDLDLDIPAQIETTPKLRLSAAATPWRLQQHRAASQRFMLLLVLWALSATGLGWRLGGGLGLLGGLWTARLLWVCVDFIRWLQPAFPAQRLPALPGDFSSLIDPAYFATPFAGGWLASAADAVLSALLVAGTARLIVKHGLRTAGRHSREVSLRSASAVPGAESWWRAGFFALLAGLLLIVLRTIIFEVVDNANARLIGPKVPVRFLTFWALHFVLVLTTGSVISVLTVWAARWRRFAKSVGGGVLTVAVAAAVAVAIPQLAWTVRLTLVLLVGLIWWTSPLVMAREFPLRRLSLVAPLLMLVLWNYAVLAEAYSRSEMTWLERKGDLLTLPQDDWIQFLMEDVLAEMADTEFELPPSDVYSRRAEELWQNRAAFDLWQRSAVRDLGLPCLVEILDVDGMTESLFASGFMRDYGYEVLSRSGWRISEPAGFAEPLDIALQSEIRRYPTGQERVLRGEVARQEGLGWIRLELPVQSKRITSLLTRLAGQRLELDAGGYRPRVEIDRPLLLLRGNQSGWLDAGPSSFPDADSQAVLEALKSGAVARGTIKVDGERYRCLWLPVADRDGSTTDEGFLLGLQMPSLIDRLLDMSRLLLLSLLLLGALFALSLPWRLVSRRWGGFSLGFQERFLVGYLVLGLLLLLLAGMFVDRLNLDRLVTEARNRSRDGLAAALAQLQGLLSEQARALAESDYIADLLANRLAGQRPMGPFSARQGMVFTGDGQLLLDETLSDLNDAEALLLLSAARRAPLVVMEEAGELYLGTTIPIDLSGVLPSPTTVASDTATLSPVDSLSIQQERVQDGFFFYRQRVNSDLLTGLAEIVQGEVTLHAAGEAVLASHPERIFSGLTPLMTPSAMLLQLLGHPIGPYLYPPPGTRLSFTGCLALPALALDPPDPDLHRRQTPAVLTVNFPAREREFAEQRMQTVLLFSGLATLIFLTAALLAMLMTWNIFGPVRMLVTATRRLAAGDFAAPLPESGRDEIGTLAASFASMRDELQQAQATLAAREQFLATVLKRVPVGVVVYDTDGDVVVLNPAAESILPGFFAESSGQRREQARGLLLRFQEVIGPQEQGEGELRSQDGRCTLRGRLAPLELPDGRRDRMIVFEDVTEFLSNKRLALNAELARQVAHEIKNPLTPIQLSVQHLRQAYKDRAPLLDQIVEKTIDQVLEQVTLLRSIATEFSLLGRPDELDCSPVDLESLVRKVISSYQAEEGGAPAQGPRVDLAPGPVPPVRAHVASLVKILGNLMENSIEACGGPANLDLQIAWRVDDRTVTLVWTDNGPGLAADVADRLFDPYFSTKSQGTGLGLAICRNLLDKMGGGIRLTNRPDAGGALAEVTLPRAETDDAEDSWP